MQANVFTKMQGNSILFWLSLSLSSSLSQKYAFRNAEDLANEKRRAWNKTLFSYLFAFTLYYCLLIFLEPVMFKYSCGGNTNGTVFTSEQQQNTLISTFQMFLTFTTKFLYIYILFLFFSVIQLIILNLVDVARKTPTVSDQTWVGLPFWLQS